MNNARSIFLLIFVCLALPLAPEPVLALDSLDSMLQPYLSDRSIPALAAAVAKSGEIVAAGAVGVRRAGTDIPVTINDRFHIGSDTKAITALLAAIMVEEGKLRWESTPADIFPELASGMDAGFAKATLTQFLSHASGLPSDNDDIGDIWSRALLLEGNLDAMRYFAVRECSKKPLVAPPGTKFEYSNMGFVVVGAMIERVAGKTWDELMFERVFTPLGLTTAGLGCQSSIGKVDAPLSHVEVDGKVKALLAGPFADNPPILGPAGIAHMSILDFARWASWNAAEGRRGPALVSPETRRKLHTPVITPPLRGESHPGAPQAKAEYGFGWAVLEVDFAPNTLLQHTGSNDKNLASVWVDVKNDMAIVLAANIAGPKAKAAMNALARELYKKYSDMK